ncbi:Protein EFL-3 [Aphelenchoides avenae]|nr:Protein EFL-3 [Aphelenchus avenae]
MALEAIRMSASQNDENGDFIDVCSNEDENSMMSLATTASNHSTETAPFSQAATSCEPSQAKSFGSQASLANDSGVGSLSQKPSQGQQKDGSEDSDDEAETEHTSRKEKSLGKLCKRFLAAMGEEAKSGNDVHLETVAKKMATEKRRIYDLVNVMEALEAMCKTNKSFYRWNGLSSLPQLMSQLQKEAIEDRLPERILQVEQAMCSFVELSARRSSDTVGSLVEEGRASTSSLKSFSPSGSEYTAAGMDASRHSLPLSRMSSQQQQLRDRNGKNSLAQLCRRFLMVLLCNPKDRRKVSLDVASTVLIKDPASEGFEPPSRSRCRRLYDIANVLVAMGLIKKVHYLFGTKKIPLFVYCGPEPDENPATAHVSMSEFIQRSGFADISAFLKVPEMPQRMRAPATVTVFRAPFGDMSRNSFAQLRPNGQRSVLLPRTSTYAGSTQMSQSTAELVQSLQRHSSENGLRDMSGVSSSAPLKRSFGSILTPKQETCVSAPPAKAQRLSNAFDEENKENFEDLPKPQPRLPPTSAFPMQIPQAASPVNALSAYAAAMQAVQNPFLQWTSSQQGLNFLASAAAAALSTQQRQDFCGLPFAAVSTAAAMPSKVPHSVTSILGASQKANVENTGNMESKVPISPRAFKPVNRQPFSVLKQ